MDIALSLAGMIGLQMGWVNCKIVPTGFQIEPVNGVLPGVL
tara:strand:- start:33623 stop:33745 length:123 start_codon:yes stop_codon:yes gene_type:complete